MTTISIICVISMMVSLCAGFAVVFPIVPKCFLAANVCGYGRERGGGEINGVECVDAAWRFRHSSASLSLGDS